MRRGPRHPGLSFVRGFCFTALDGGVSLVWDAPREIR